MTFFTPYFWSRGAVAEPRFAGQLLDTRPSNPNRALQMETQYIPAAQATDAHGNSYARIAPTQFPVEAGGDSALVHRVTSYSKHALWDAVQAWFDGGAPASGEINSSGAVLHKFPGSGGATWRIYTNGVARENKVPLAWNSFATPTAPDAHTFGYKWNSQWVKKDNGLIVLPEYFRLTTNANKKPVWTPVRAEEVPAETGLAAKRFDQQPRRTPKSYETPDAADSSWKTPGPKAGPFHARLGDGSVVTYYWYRFADQPAMLNADMTGAEREAMQARVEKLHRAWNKDREYLAPPEFGKLAALDPALIVTPPKELAVGYVPIVTRQSVKE